MISPITDQPAADWYAAAGASFVGVGIDTSLLATATSDLVDRFMTGER